MKVNVLSKSNYMVEFFNGHSTLPRKDWNSFSYISSISGISGCVDMVFAKAKDRSCEVFINKHDLYSYLTIPK